MSKKLIKLETVSKPDIPNINGIIYSKEEFDKCIENIKLNNMKLYLTITPYPIVKESFLMVESEYIIGEIKEINYNYISVLIDEEKEDLIEKYINIGYKTGMRYLAEVNNKIATNLNIICFDMINDYNNDKKFDKKDNDEIKELEEKIKQVKEILYSYSQIDGSHHKAWCLDQIARIVYGNKYDDFINEYCEDGKYEWDCGIAP